MPVFPGTGRIQSAVNRHLSRISLILKRPDIVHETYYSMRTSAPPGSKIVITVYDMIHELFPDFFSGLDRTSQLKKIAVERADFVICISENTRRDLIRLLGVKPEKTAVVHLGVSFANSPVARLRMVERPFILYVGSRGGYKNFFRLLRAYASRIELCGPYELLAFGGGALSNEELDMIDRFGIPRGQVRQLSGGDDVLAALYSEAIMFVYPSLYEGFGLPPLEAMSYNCPVACSNTSSIPEIAGEAAIYFDPLDVDSIADALVCLSADPGLRARQIALGRSRAALFSWEQCAMKTLNIYQALLR